MKKPTTISVAQMVMLLMISRFIVSLTYSNYFSNVKDMWYNVFAAIGGFIVTLFMVIPVYLLYKNDRNLTVVDNGYVLLKGAGIIIGLVYGIYFLWVLIYNLIIFNVFISDVMNPSISASLLSLAVIISSMYGAWKGIEGIARTATVVLVVAVILVILINISLFDNIDPYNMLPLTTEKLPAVWEEMLGMITRNSCIVCMGMLLPLTTGKAKRGIAFWAVSVYCSIAGIVYMTVAVLGDYVKTQSFPMYALASVSNLGVIERLDGIFLGIWTAGIFIKMSLFIYLVSACVKRMFGELASRVSILVSGAVALIISNISVHHDFVINFFFNKTVLLCLTVGCAFVIPLILLIVRKAKKNKNRRKSVA